MDLPFSDAPPVPKSAPRAGDLVVAIDPGDESGWAITRLGPVVRLVAAGSIRRVEKQKNGRPMNFERLLPINAALIGAPLPPGGMIHPVLEDMPAAFFKSRAAGEAFVASRTRWADAFLSNDSATAARSLHLQRWRRVAGIDKLARGLARRVVKERDSLGIRVAKERLDFKRAARVWCSRVFGLTVTNDNEAEAIVIAWVAAKLLFQGEWDGSEPRSGGGRARKRAARPARSRGDRK